MLFPDEKYYPVVLAFVFLSLLMILNHEPWRDEAQAWLIARDSPDLQSVFRMGGYESTPMLWHLLLYPLAKLGAPYSTMFLLHFAIALAGVVVFLKHAPFTRLQKTLFVSGYYVFYEYNVIARSYALSLLLLFLTAALYRERFSRPLAYSSLLFLLANTNVHSMVVAAVFGALYFYEILLEKSAGPAGGRALPLLIVLSGLLVSVYQVMPPADLDESVKHWNLDFGPSHVLPTLVETIVGAFMPVPKLVIGFWNSLLYSKTFWNVLYLYRISWSIWTLSGIILLAGSLRFFKDTPKPFFLYAASLAGLFAIFLLKYSGGLRHYGLVYVVFAVALWIAGGVRPGKDSKELDCLFTLFLACQVMASAVAFYYEVRYDFSAGGSVAGFLLENGFINDNTFIAAYSAPYAASILPYIPRPYSGFYYPEYGGRRSFTVWNTEYNRSMVVSNKGLVAAVDRAVGGKEYGDVLLILNGYIIVYDKKFFGRYEMVASFNETIVEGESFYVYKLKKPNAI